MMMFVRRDLGSRPILLHRFGNYTAALMVENEQVSVLPAPPARLTLSASARRKEKAVRGLWSDIEQCELTPQEELFFVLFR
jgi:hypothetical protein